MGRRLASITFELGHAQQRIVKQGHCDLGNPPSLVAVLPRPPLESGPSGGAESPWKVPSRPVASVNWAPHWKAAAQICG